MALIVIVSHLQRACVVSKGLSVNGVKAMDLSFPKIFQLRKTGNQTLNTGFAWFARK